MGNTVQKEESANRGAHLNYSGNTTPYNNLVTAPTHRIFERITTDGNNFNIIVNCKAISSNSPKTFSDPRLPLTISFIVIEDDLYILLEPKERLFTALMNALYSVNLISLHNADYALDVNVDEPTLIMSKSLLRRFEWADGNCVFEMRMTQSSPSSARQTIQRPVIAQSQQSSGPSVSYQQRPSESDSAVLQPPSAVARQTSAEQASVRSQQTLAQPSTASPPQTLLNDKLKFEEIQRSSDNSFATGKFRLTVSELRNLVQVRGPLFSFDNMQIGFTVSKNSRNNANESLRVILYHKDLKGGWLTMESKLISAYAKNPIVKKVNRLNIPNNNTCSDMIAWNKLFTHPNVFVRNDSCVIEVEIKIGKNRTAAINGGEQNNNNPSRTKCPEVRASGPSSAPRIECPICMDEMANKPKSSTQCGHIYCTVCISRSLLTKSTCPLCNEAVSVASLRPIFLP